MRIGNLKGRKLWQKMKGGDGKGERGEGLAMQMVFMAWRLWLEGQLSMLCVCGVSVSMAASAAAFSRPVYLH